jgi:hypothetical protein
MIGRVLWFALCFLMAWIIGMGIWATLYEHGWTHDGVAVAVFLYFGHGALLAAWSDFLALK